MKPVHCLSPALFAFVALALGCGSSPPGGHPTSPDPAGSTTTSRPSEPAAPRPAFSVHIVDVGTGLGVFIHGADFSMVYDAGSNDDTATGDNNRFIAYLHAAFPDLRAIAHVVLSHPHRDHVELLPDVLLDYQVDNVWEPGVVNPICGYRRFIEAIATSPSIHYHSAASPPGKHEIDFEKTLCKPELPARVTVDAASRVIENAPIRLGARATMTFLHADGARHGDDFNESSLVALLDLDGTRVLLMGDAEAGGRDDPKKPPSRGSVEGYVLATYPALIDADVLIAGHHGSKSSSRAAFLAAVSPKISVISAGPTKYHAVTLPDPEVVAELERRGKVMRTDRHDDTCADDDKKIGPDADGNPGGCDNIVIQIQAGKLEASYSTLAD